MTDWLLSCGWRAFGLDARRATYPESQHAKEAVLSGHPEPRKRRRLSYANVTSTLALVIAIGGGSAYAASHLITGKQIAPGTITAKNIKSHSLLSSNFKKGQIPAGPRGAPGTNGANGTNGAPGTAVAYGEVTINGAGNPSFISNVGFGGVTSPQADVFCVVPPSGDVGIPILISVFGASSNAAEQVSAQQCPGDYEIESSGAFTAGQGFTIVVP
jgi:hypothetical protein